MRKLIAKLIAPIMAITGYRFDKSHRQNETLVYKLINVSHANIQADYYIYRRLDQIEGRT